MRFKTKPVINFLKELKHRLSKCVSRFNLKFRPILSCFGHTLLGYQGLPRVLHVYACVILFLGGPQGKPIILPKHLSKYANEQIKLTCNTQSLDPGNPKCSTYIWSKLGDGNVKFSRIIVQSNALTFKMEAKYEGKYQCKCENNYGQSNASDVSVVWLVNSSSASKQRCILLI